MFQPSYFVFLTLTVKINVHVTIFITEQVFFTSRLPIYLGLCPHFRINVIDIKIFLFSGDYFFCGNSLGESRNQAQYFVIKNIKGFISITFYFQVRTISGRN